MSTRAMRSAPRSYSKRRSTPSEDGIVADTGSSFNTPPKRLHTSGPWHVEEGDVFSADHNIANVFGADGSLPEAPDNARLIAAAPDGLAAAKFARLVLLAKGGSTAAERREAVHYLSAFINRAEKGID